MRAGLQEGNLRAIVCVLIHHWYGKPSTVEVRGGVLWRPGWFPSTAADFSTGIGQEHHAGLLCSHLGEEEAHGMLVLAYTMEGCTELVLNMHLTRCTTIRKSPTTKQKSLLGSITSRCINASGCNRCCWTPQRREMWEMCICWS